MPKHPNLNLDLNLDLHLTLEPVSELFNAVSLERGCERGNATRPLAKQQQKPPGSCPLMPSPALQRGNIDRPVNTPMNSLHRGTSETMVFAKLRRTTTVSPSLLIQGPVRLEKLPPPVSLVIFSFSWRGSKKKKKKKTPASSSEAPVRNLRSPGC